MAVKKFTGAITDTWTLFSPVERRNIIIYIIGIMLYKFGLEAFNGSVVALATNRYDYEAFVKKTSSRTFERTGLLTGLNQAAQCVGSILIAPLVKKFPAKWVLSTAILIFGVFAALLLIIDAATGGSFVPAKYRSKHPKNAFEYYGKYNTDGMIPIYTFAGIVYGMVELMRRVIPRDIVGGNVQKLRRMDALVHIFYEVAGTSGAFCTALGLIPRFGNNYSFIITPIFFLFAAIAWSFIGNMTAVGGGDHLETALDRQPSYVKAVLGGFWLFGESVYTGAWIIFTNRKFIWLIPGYSIALYGHRFLENNISPYVARRYLGNSAWSQIMVGGSNLGELFGALLVFLFTNLVHTPMPFLRLDALTLLIPWYFGYWYPPSGQVKYAWIAAATMIPVSFGWAAGDVSLAAFIQASLARLESKTKNVSALGAVMAFLYCFYIVTYAIASPLIGRYVDRVYNLSGGEKGGDIHIAVRNVGGIQFTLIAALIIAATFIPKGAWAFNPPMLNDEYLEEDLKEESGDFDDVGPYDATLAEQTKSGEYSPETKPETKIG